MKNVILLLIIIASVFACNSSKKVVKPIEETTETIANDTITISGDQLEYDVIIIEPGFGMYLNSTAKPSGFYTQNYMETRNIQYVQEWNRRVTLPSTYNTSLYEMTINYRHGVDYGYDVNYKMYNYFIYFQNKYNQNLLNTRVPQN